MIPRPRFRMPAWAAIAIVVAAFAVGKWVRGESLTLRGTDAFVLALVLVGIAVAVWLRRSLSREAEQADDEADGEDHDRR